MPILPAGASTLTFTITASSISEELFVDSVTVKKTTEKFDREEFSNSKLKELRSANGTSPIYQENIVKKPIQYVFVGPCGDSEVRATGVDDDNVNLIKNKFIIKRWTIKGGPSDPDGVDTIEDIALDHARRLSKFEGRNEKLGMDNLSYTLIKAMQSETLDYLTTTGLTMTGVSVDTEDNLLITDFTSEAIYQDTALDIIIAKTWDMTIESRTIEPLIFG